MMKKKEKEKVNGLFDAFIADQKNVEFLKRLNEVGVPPIVGFIIRSVEQDPDNKVLVKCLKSRSKKKYLGKLIKELFPKSIFKSKEVSIRLRNASVFIKK